MNTNNLNSLNQLFTHRILRIPDYQRGFAWGKDDQILDFWEDLRYLDDARVHYTGLITLEPVQDIDASKWEDDAWLIENLEFQPYYVVDGQQRLTTSIILIQVLLDTLDDEVLLDQSLAEIKKKFIVKTAADEQKKSYLFGYEKDDPSNEFLKSQIFGEHSDTNLDQQTLYTRNLVKAKEFFEEKLQDWTLDKKENIFKRLTQNFRFNLFEIDSELEVCVAFETMNNRGKPLSNLELLKNRLIYLSTLYPEDSGGKVLRKKINNAWKTIYAFLGKNPDAPLSDDEFLRGHWTMYFKYSRKKANEYFHFLTKEKFIAQNVTRPKPENQRLSVSEIDEYVTNLQQSIKPWFHIHNPYKRSVENDENNLELLDRLNKLNFGAFRPLLLAAYVKEHSADEIHSLLQAAERYLFVLFKISQRRSNTGDSEFFRCARDLFLGNISIQEIIDKLNDWIKRYYDKDNFLHYIKDRFLHQKGFYDWNGLHYFLFEYEQYLRSESMNSDKKLDWHELVKQRTNYVTIEHIYPQIDTDDYWQNRFSEFDDQQIINLKHSLGNLLPLSRAKNSSLQNRNFELKKDNGNGVGYYNGSFSEIEVSRKTEWNAQQILDRGIDMLNFMEKRWDMSIGDDQFKTRLLHLDFLPLRDDEEKEVCN